MAKYRAEDIYENMGVEENPQTGVTVSKKEGRTKVTPVMPTGLDDEKVKLNDRLNYSTEQAYRLARSYAKGYITDQSSTGKCDICGEATNSYERTLCHQHALQFMKEYLK